MKRLESTAVRVARKRRERSFSYRAEKAYTEIDSTMQAYFPRQWDVAKGVAVGATLLLLMGFGGGAPD